MSQKRTEHRMRRRWLIYPHLQLAQLLANWVVLLATLSFIAWELWQAFGHLQHLGEKAGIPLTHPYFKFLGLQKTDLISRLLVAGGLSFAFSTLLGLFISQKVAGPILRLMSHLRQLKKTGRYSELKFRKNDFFSDLPILVNDLTHSFMGRRGESQGPEAPREEKIQVNSQ